MRLQFSRFQVWAWSQGSYFLFTLLKKFLWGKRFSNNDELKVTVSA